MCNRLCASVAAGLYFLMLRVPGELPVSCSCDLLHSKAKVKCNVSMQT